MQNDTYSVEVIGFTDTEQTVLNSVFGLSARRVPKYVRHTPADGMPNIFLVDSNDEAAIKQLGVRNAVGDIQVVLIGDNTCGTNWVLLARPIRWMKLFQAFDAIVGVVPPAVAATPATANTPDATQAFAKPNLVTPASLTASIEAKAPPVVAVPTREALLEKIAATTAKMQSFNPAVGNDDGECVGSG